MELADLERRVAALEARLDAGQAAAEPTEEMAEEPTGEMTLASDTSKSIATLLSEDENFSTLVAAITAAEIAEPGPDAPITLFAPTNAAFEALPEGMVDELLADPAGDLTRILQYHIVNGAVKAADVGADEDGFVDTLAAEPLDQAQRGQGERRGGQGSLPPQDDPQDGPRHGAHQPVEERHPQVDAQNIRLGAPERFHRADLLALLGDHRADLLHDDPHLARRIDRDEDLHRLAVLREDRR